LLSATPGTVSPPTPCRGAWDAEATQVSDDAPTFAQPSIPVYKAAGFVPVSIEALQDMANGAAEVARLLAFGKDVLEAAAFAVGSGSGQPTGVVTGLVGSGAVTNLGHHRHPRRR
jgi:HK97 family phage major capsid protein